MENFFKNFNVNLDLAVEAREIIRGQTGREIPGVTLEKESYTYTVVTIIKILDESAEMIMGKPRGTYITIEAPVIRENNRLAHQQVAEILARKLSTLLNLPESANILLIGLGNWHTTPDALGPRVIEYSLVTRHLFKYAPQELKGGMRPVSALAPGVLGITGIETAEIIKGVVEKTQPALIIAIDALAAQSVERIATTIQLADTGISPGGGVGNKRAGINFESMGVPVIAIGVPTVVNAAVIARATVNNFLEQLKINSALYQISQEQEIEEKVQQSIEKILEPFAGNLTVTPKEIDSLIQNTAKIIAGGISIALHPSLPPEEYSRYLQN